MAAVKALARFALWCALAAYVLFVAFSYAHWLGVAATIAGVLFVMWAIERPDQAWPLLGGAILIGIIAATLLGTGALIGVGFGLVR